MKKILILSALSISLGGCATQINGYEKQDFWKIFVTGSDVGAHQFCKKPVNAELVGNNLYAYFKKNGMSEENLKNVLLQYNYVRLDSVSRQTQKPENGYCEREIMQKISKNVSEYSVGKFHEIK